MTGASPLTLAIDVGTQSVRTLLFDASGTPRWQTRRELALARHSDSDVEQDAVAIAAHTNTIIAEARAAAKALFATITSAGMATQRSTVVAWNRRTRQPLAPALSWQDTRVTGDLKRLTPHAAFIHTRSGLPLSPHYGALKIAWLIQHSEAVRQAHRQGELVVGPLAGFLANAICESATPAVDVSNAQRMQLLNLDRGEWDAQLLTLFDLDAALLPQPMPIIHHYGNLTHSEIPLRALCGDQVAATYAWGKIDNSSCQINCGTGIFLLARKLAGQTAARPLLEDTGIVDDTGSDHFVEATVNGGGAALTWLAEQLGAPITPQQIDTAAAPAAQHAPLFINGVGGLGSPWWRSDVAPAFVAIDGTPATPDPAAMRMAAVESMLFLLRTNLDVMQAQRPPGAPICQLSLGGGLSHSDAFCQAVCDVTGLAVSRNQERETTARGIARLAANLPQWPQPMWTHFTTDGTRRRDARYARFMAHMPEMEAHV